jgi:hypothetical protein
VMPTGKREVKIVRVLGGLVFRLGCDSDAAQNVSQRALAASHIMELAQFGESGNVSLTKIRQNIS